MTHRAWHWLDSTKGRIISLGVISLGVIIALIFALAAQVTSSAANQHAATVAVEQARQTRILAEDAQDKAAAAVTEKQLEHASCTLVKVGAHPKLPPASAYDRAKQKAWADLGQAIGCPTP